MRERTAGGARNWIVFPKRRLIIAAVLKIECVREQAGRAEAVQLVRYKNESATGAGALGFSHGAGSNV